MSRNARPDQRQKHPLATLLRIRRQREDVARHGVAVAQGCVSALENRAWQLRQMQAQRDAGARQILLEGGGELESYRRGQREIRLELSGLDGELDKVRARLMQRRGELATAVRQRRALAFVEARRESAELSQKRRRAQKELEEMHSAHDAGRYVASGPDADAVASAVANGM